jgi:hypothetical protein
MTLSDPGALTLQEIPISFEAAANALTDDDPVIR